MERIITKKIVQYLDQNALLFQRQHGFRSGASTQLLLLDLVNTISTAIDGGGRCDLVSMDISKAFDTVDHRLLIHKLTRYGLPSNIIDWYCSFLQDRKQQVIVNNSLSPISKITSGVPQGTVSGPILFSLYINDLPNVIHSRAYLYADDLTIVRQVASGSDRDTLQADLNAAYTWCKDWRLTINPTKTNYIEFSRCRKSHQGSNNKKMYTINNQDITPVDEICCLGVTLDAALNWNSHIENITSRSKASLRSLCGSLRDASPVVRELAFNVLVRSILDYADVVWDPFTTSNIKLIESVQRSAARFVSSNWLRETCVTALLQNLKWPTLQTRRREHRLTMLYAIIHNLTIINPQDLLHRPHYYGRRDNTEKIRKIPGHSEAHRRTFFPATVDLWNSLPQDMVSSRNIETFKNKLRTNRPLLQCTHQTF